MESKANNGSGNNEGRDSWETPKKLWDKLDQQVRLNKHLSYQQTEKIILDRSKQKRL